MPRASRSGCCAAELDALREGGAALTDVESLRAELETLRDGADRVAELAVALESLREDGAARADVEVLRAELKTLRAAAEQAEAAGERDAKGSADRIEQIAGLARAAHDAAAAGRADQDELRAAVARLGGELVVAREQVEQAAEEALGARGPCRRGRRGREAPPARMPAACARTPQQLRREQAAGNDRLEAAAADVARVDRELSGVPRSRSRVGGGERARPRLDAPADRRRAHRGAGRRRSCRERGARGRAAGRARRGAPPLAEQAGSGVAELRAEVGAVRTLAELANAVAEQSRLASEKQLLAAQAETVVDPGEQAAQVFREMLGLATTSRSGTLEKPQEKPAPEPRSARPGFDDDPAPMATIGIDGKFKQLNPSFCRLVGYQEHEFAKAALAVSARPLALCPAAGGVLRADHGHAGARPRREHVHARRRADGPDHRGDQAVKGEDGRTSHLLLRVEERERAELSGGRTPDERNRAADERAEGAPRAGAASPTNRRIPNPSSAPSSEPRAAPHSPSGPGQPRGPRAADRPAGPPGSAPELAKPRRWFRRFVALIALVFIGAALYVINATFQPFQDEREEAGGVAVQIPEGADAGSIGELLERKGVVADARFFELNATLTLRRGKLLTGNYVLRRNMTNGAAIDALLQGPKVRVVRTFDVTVPEGLSRREAAPAFDRAASRAPT